MLLVLSWISTSLFFSSSFIISSVVARYDMPLEFMMFYRMMMSCAFIAVIIFIKKQRLLIKKNELWYSIIIASSQLNVWLSCYGTKYLVSGLVPCITLTQIFVAEALSAIYEKRKMKSNVLISGIIGLIGIIMLCNQQLNGVADADFKKTLLGIFLSFISTICASFGNLVYEKSNENFKKMPRSTFLFYNCFFAGIGLLIVGVIINPLHYLASPVLLDKTYLISTTYLAITSTVIALFALYYIIDKQGSVKATYMNFIMPVLSMIISTFLEGFHWNVIAFVGMIILLISVWIGIRK